MAMGAANVGQSLRLNRAVHLLTGGIGTFWVKSARGHGVGPYLTPVARHR